MEYYSKKENNESYVVAKNNVTFYALFSLI